MLELGPLRLVPPPFTQWAPLWLPALLVVLRHDRVPLQPTPSVKGAFERARCVARLLLRVLLARRPPWVEFEQRRSVALPLLAVPYRALLWVAPPVGQVETPLDPPQWFLPELRQRQLPEHALEVDQRP